MILLLLSFSVFPITVVYLRLALRAASFFADTTSENERQGYEFVTLGAHRLQEVLGKVTAKSPNVVLEQYQRERRGWDLYYDILDAVEQALRHNDDFACELQQRARCFIQDCQIHFGSP